MARVAPINLAYNPRTLWFHPGDFEIKRGDHVVVETARGAEFGTAASDIIEVTQKEIKSLKSPLKPVVRLATDEDVAHAAEMERRSREALPCFQEARRRVGRRHASRLRRVPSRRRQGGVLLRSGGARRLP